MTRIMTPPTVLAANLLAILMLVACTSKAAIIHETTGQFGSIVVEEHPMGVRTLRFSRNGARQSVVKLGDPDHLELSYARTVLAGLALSGKSRRMLVLGLGGGSLPMFLHKNYPDATIDVVEIDPGVVAVARKFFEVREDRRLMIHVQDARRFVESAQSGIYDLILVDAFGANSAPAHLTTQEFMRSLRRAVSKEGVVVGNLWRRAFNPQYDSMLLTYRSVFESSILLDVPGDANSILLALPRSDAPDRERFSVQAGNLAKAKGFRVDLETMVKNAYQAGPALKLQGGILFDTKANPAP